MEFEHLSDKGLTQWQNKTNMDKEETCKKKEMIPNSAKLWNKWRKKEKYKKPNTERGKQGNEEAGED